MLNPHLDVARPALASLAGPYSRLNLGDIVDVSLGPDKGSHHVAASIRCRSSVGIGAPPTSTTLNFATLPTDCAGGPELSPLEVTVRSEPTRTRKSARLAGRSNDRSMD